MYAIGSWQCPPQYLLGKTTIDVLLLPFSCVASLVNTSIVMVVQLGQIHLLKALLSLQYGSFFLSYTFFGLMYATGQFPALVETGLPLEGLQFALLMYALLSVIFIGLSIRMNFALTCLFTVIALAYFCLGIGQTHGERVVKVRGHFIAWSGHCKSFARV